VTFGLQGLFGLGFSVWTLDLNGFSRISPNWFFCLDIEQASKIIGEALRL
jgi:hypothetical protein